jgi:hypothetical protein
VWGGEAAGGRRDIDEQRDRSGDGTGLVLRAEGAIGVAAVEERALELDDARGARREGADRLVAGTGVLEDLDGGVGLGVDDRLGLVAGEVGVGIVERVVDEGRRVEGIR